MKFDIENAARRLRTTANIVTDPRGGPIRRIINGRHRKPTGRYSSVNAHRSMPWEDRRERDYFMHCEADSNVATYLAQPHRLEIHVGLRDPLVLLPDLRRDMADGRVAITEVKKRYTPDPFYALKIDLARDVYTSLGWSFDIIEADEIYARPAFDTAKAIQADKDAELTVAQRFAVVEALEKAGGAIAYGALCEKLGGGVMGPVFVHAAVVRRVAAIELRQRLLPDTPVTRAPSAMESR